MDSKFRAFARLAGQKNHHLVVLLGARVVVAAVALFGQILNLVFLSDGISFSEIEESSLISKKESLSNSISYSKTAP